MALDHRRRVSVDRNALDHIRIGGSLRKKFRIFNLRGRVVEHLDKLVADDLALLLRLIHSGKLVEEAVGGVDVDQFHGEVAAEKILHPLRLVFAEQPVVDENAVELTADRLVDQRRGN